MSKLKPTVRTLDRPAPTLAALIDRGGALDAEIKRLQADLAEVRSAIVERGTTHIDTATGEKSVKIVGHTHVATVTLGSEPVVYEGDAEIARLRAILGDRFDLLFSTKTTATAKRDAVTDFASTPQTAAKRESLRAEFAERLTASENTKTTIKFAEAKE